MAIREHAPCVRADSSIPVQNVHEAPLHCCARGSGQCEELILSGNRVIAEWSAQGVANSMHARNTRASSCAGNIGA